MNQRSGTQPSANATIRPFTVLIVTDPSLRTNIEKIFPHSDFVSLRFLSILDVHDDTPETADRLLFGIHSPQIRRMLEIKRAWKRTSGTAVIAESMNTHDVVKLMRAGVSEVFDLHQDGALIREWLMMQYEEHLKEPAHMAHALGPRPENTFRGISEGIQRVRDLAVQAAQYPDLAVLIHGETGTGKEMVARLIHDRSPRSSGPFIEVNCSAIPETLMESEMLGYEKGAFTDARRARKGFFEMADGGTLFLDEIGVMPPSLQNKILKIVEEKTFRRLGGESEVAVDVKIVAGTNTDLQKAAETGRFRPDLYYRLNVFSILIPALRDRICDIPVLATHFLERIVLAYQLKISGFHPSTEALLIRYSWPGNVRELKHVVERACVIAQRGRILPSHLPDEIQTAAAPPHPAPADLPPEQMLCIPLPDDGISMTRIERLIMLDVLKRCGGNQSKAARFLKISRTRLARYVTDDPDDYAF
ncbi:sigma-54-dependent Fis family transcriptional regulator [bacterium]|nr:sigma-54-dependent Fis family transcriptional regulator [candidate division CSSED10-310 bacterium]